MTVLGVKSKDSIDAALALAKKFPYGDDEITSHWARYICILTSGYIEISLRSILTEYAITRSHRNVVNYVESRLEGITNLNEEKIYQLLVSFNPSWGELFRKLRSDAQKDALDSVVANRNQIAHGRSVGLTITRMSDYYQEIVKVIKFIDKQCVK